MNDRIFRTREDRMVLGVLGGFSLRFGIDPSIARVAYAVVTLLTGIVPLLILYFVMAIVIPEAPPGWEAAIRAAGPTAPPPPSWMQEPQPGAWPPAEQPASSPSQTWPAPGGDATAAAGGAAAVGVSAGAAGAGATGVGAAGAAAAGTQTPAAAGGPGWAAVAPPATSAGPAPAWGAGWDASGRPIPGEAAEHARDSRTGAIIGGLVLVGIGAAFLLAQVAPQLDWGLAGPVLLIALGVVLVLASIRRA